jgi:hypothetical protein
MSRPKGVKNKVKEVGEPPVGIGKPPVDENYLFIENLPEITEQVKALIAEKKLNPGVVHEEDAGTVFLEGEACMVIDNKYVPVKEAKLVLQTRKVVREYIKLQNLINNINDEII